MLAACPTFALLVLAGLFTLFAPLSTLADGKVFRPHAVPVEVRIPDQRALLWWTNGVERLVIETRFTGQGTNFAWVVPLPAPPKVEAATKGLFPTLLHLLQPSVIHNVTGWFWLAVSAAGLGWFCFQIRKTGATRWGDYVAAAAIGTVGLSDWELWSLGIPLVVTFAFMARRVRLSGGRFFDWLGALGLMVVMTALFLPALAKAKAKGSSDSVEVLDRQLAGIFETTTITGRDPAALRGWLETNGYAMPKEVEPVIADYLRDGWVFVASKVRRDNGAPDTNSLRPLSFTFAAKEPVYPLRLTGVGNGPLDVELFAFGPQRAQANGFKVLDCRPTDYRQRDYPEWFVPRDRLPMAHPGLVVAAPESTLVTRLSGQLSPDQMRQDAVIRWDGFIEARGVRYSLRGALVTAFNWTGSAFCLFVLGVAIMSRARGVEPATYSRATMLAGGAGVVVTGIVYFSLPVVPVKLEKRFVRYSDAKNQFYAVRFALMDELPTNAPVTLESVRAAIQRGLPFHLTNGMSRPYSFTIREEDSPYNYSLRAVPGGVEVLFHDAWGRPEVERYPQ